MRQLHILWRGQQVETFRIVRCHYLREHNDLSLGSLRFERIQVDSQTFARQAPQSFIHGDAGKPGRKTGIAAKAIHIFGFGVVPQDAAGDPVSRRLCRSMMIRNAISSRASARRTSSASSDGTAIRGAGAGFMTISLAAELDAFQGKRFPIPGMP
jgi:hypothetical protein